MEKFFDCRNEILEVLNKYQPQNMDAARILASVLNEIYLPQGWQVSISFADLPIYHGADDKNLPNINLNLNIKDSTGGLPQGSFTHHLKKVFEDELAHVQQTRINP